MAKIELVNYSDFVHATHIAQPMIVLGSHRACIHNPDAGFGIAPLLSSRDI